MRLIVLGAGSVGRAVALDLAEDKKFSVSVVDQKKEPLVELKTRGRLSVEAEDLSSPEAVKAAVERFDVVVNALPGFLGFQTLKACIEARKDVIDVAFAAEDPLVLDGLAREKGVTAVVDCGVAPGLSHMLAGQASVKLDKPEFLIIYAGGLPVRRTWPFEYATLFSPSDVIEEYLRPARFKENGQVVIQPALSEPELLEFEGLGTLEAFNTDGLRTLLHTLPFPNMKEKTLRYPGHREKIEMLKRAGFLDTRPLLIRGRKISPREITSEILFSRLQLMPGEEDVTLLRVVAGGQKKNQSLVITHELLDRYDRKKGVTSMARTTGYTASMAVRALVRGLIKERGIVPPEFLGLDQRCLDFILQGLRERGLCWSSR